MIQTFGQLAFVGAVVWFFNLLLIWWDPRPVSRLHVALAALTIFLTQLIFAVVVLVADVVPRDVIVVAYTLTAGLVILLGLAGLFPRVRRLR